MIPKTHGTVWSLLIVHDRISQYILYIDGSFNLQQSVIFYKIIIHIWSGCSVRTTDLLSNKSVSHGVRNQPVFSFVVKDFNPSGFLNGL